MSDPDFDIEDECSNCGGEGVVYCCDEPFACADPDSGCDLCARRCDWCQPPKAAVVTPPHKDT